MAGGGPHLLREDPALERYNKLKINMQHSYRFNKRSAYYAALFLIVIPGTGLYLAQKFERKQGIVFWGTQRKQPIYAAEWTPRK